MVHFHIGINVMIHELRIRYSIHSCQFENWLLGLKSSPQSMSCPCQSWSHLLYEISGAPRTPRENCAQNILQRIDPFMIARTCSVDAGMLMLERKRQVAQALKNTRSGSVSLNRDRSGYWVLQRNVLSCSLLLHYPYQISVVEALKRQPDHRQRQDGFCQVRSNKTSYRSP